MTDYILLTMVAVVGLGGGLYVLHEAKKLKAREQKKKSDSSGPSCSAIPPKGRQSSAPRP